MLTIKEAPNLFYIGNDPKNPDGHIVYSIDAKILTIWHTVVQETLKGQGCRICLGCLCRRLCP